jgi:O-antigen/teichoic acid export membrane protein
MTSAHRATSEPSLRINVAANYAGKLWSITSVYVFIPVYVRLLGIDAYGLIAFYSVALGIIFIADAGLSASFSREVARSADSRVLAMLLRSIETVLLTVLSLAAAGMVVGAEAIAVNWLNTGASLDLAIATDCLRLMGLAIVPQIAMSLYFGGLMGLQLQVRANVLYTLFSFVRSGLVVVPIFVLPDPRLFFAWQAASAWVFMLVMRRSLIVQLGVTTFKAKFSWKALRPVYMYASGMFLMSIIAGLNTQLDRLVVSKLRPLDEFAYYALAATLSQIPTIVTMPIASALLPRFTRLVETHESTALDGLYERSTFAIATLASAAAFWLFFFSGEIVQFWTSSTVLPAELSVIVKLLTMGGLFLALQLMPFQLSLAHGHNQTNVRLGAAFLLIAVPSQYLLTKHHGLVGAAVPWLVLNAAAFVYLGIVLNRRFHAGRVTRWFVRCTLPPVAICGILLCGTRIIVDRTMQPPLIACVWGAASALVAISLSVLIYRRRHLPLPNPAPL